MLPGSAAFSSAVHVLYRRGPDAVMRLRAASRCPGQARTRRGCGEPRAWRESQMELLGCFRETDHRHGGAEPLGKIWTQTGNATSSPPQSISGPANIGVKSIGKLREVCLLPATHAILTQLKQCISIKRTIHLDTYEIPRHLEDSLRTTCT